MDNKTGVGGQAIAQQGKKDQQKKKPVRVDRVFIITTTLIAFVIYFFFTIGTWVMIDLYHRSTLKRVVRVEKKLDAANKQIKWMRKAFGITVKGRVKDGSRLDRLIKQGE